MQGGGNIMMRKGFTGSGICTLHKAGGIVSNAHRNLGTIACSSRMIFPNIQDFGMDLTLTFLNGPDLNQIEICEPCLNVGSVSRNTFKLISDKKSGQISSQNN
ncbi:hypothetical protein ILYODFUR_021305, partial [Ilyodon furcidens]